MVIAPVCTAAFSSLRQRFLTAGTHQNHLGLLKKYLPGLHSKDRDSADLREKQQCMYKNLSRGASCGLTLKNWSSLMYTPQFDSTAGRIGHCPAFPAAGGLTVNEEICPGGLAWASCCLHAQRWKCTGPEATATNGEQKRTHVISGQRTSCPRHWVSPGR